MAKPPYDSLNNFALDERVLAISAKARNLTAFAAGTVTGWTGNPAPSPDTQFPSCSRVVVPLLARFSQ